MDEVKSNIYKFLENGMFKKDAAMMAGVSESTLYRWIDEDKSFESRVEASILIYKQSLIRKINRAAEKDGRLALEVLSRRFPNEWSANRLNEIEDDEVSIQKIATIIENAYKENHKS